MGVAASLLAPAAFAVFSSLAAIMGGSSSQPGAPVDVDALVQSALEAQEKAHEEQRRVEQEELQRQKASANADRELLSQLRTQQQQGEQNRQREREDYEARIRDLTANVRGTEEKLRNMLDEMQRPVRDLAAKMAFVNELKLKIRQTESLLLLGPKGTGKSTFLWLLKKGHKPAKAYDDGNAQFIHGEGFVDSIGLRGWTPEEVLKLFVFMVYEGIPKDLIVFGNDRVQQAFAALASWGIMVPMLVIMSGEFWRKVEPSRGRPPTVTLVDNGVIRRVSPESDLDLVYDLTAYQEIRDIKLAEPVTHHDDIAALVRKRQRGGVFPFRNLTSALGSQFVVTAEQRSPIVDALFRLIYVYEKKYQRNTIAFMNHGTIQEFS